MPVEVVEKVEAIRGSTRKLVGKVDEVVEEVEEPVKVEAPVPEKATRGAKKAESPVEAEKPAEAEKPTRGGQRKAPRA